MSVDRDPLGNRMKAYEAVTRTVLPRRTYSIIRVDGKAFHSYLRGAEKPYDLQFMAYMDEVAKHLCHEISGAVFAYVQSDEISVLVTDFSAPGTQPWFGGVVAKQVSVSASLATAVLNQRRPGRMALFDSRVFTIADPVEVANYFVWRQKDCVRNSISMAAQAHFSPKRLHGVNSGQMQELLWQEKGISWNDYPDGCKRGRVVVKETGVREVTFVHKGTQQAETVRAVRSWWEVRDAPNFTTSAGGFLASVLPQMPAMSREAA